MSTSCSQSVTGPELDQTHEQYPIFPLSTNPSLESEVWRVRKIEQVSNNCAVLHPGWMHSVTLARSERPGAFPRQVPSNIRFSILCFFVGSTQSQSPGKGAIIMISQHEMIETSWDLSFSRFQSDSQLLLLSIILPSFQTFTISRESQTIHHLLTIPATKTLDR